MCICYYFYYYDFHWHGKGVKCHSNLLESVGRWSGTKPLKTQHVGWRTSWLTGQGPRLEEITARLEYFPAELSSAHCLGPLLPVIIASSRGQARAGGGQMENRRKWETRWGVEPRSSQRKRQRRWPPHSHLMWGPVSSSNGKALPMGRMRGQEGALRACSTNSQ